MTPSRGGNAAARSVPGRIEAVFFGWWIAIGGAALLGLVAGLLLQSYGTYIVLLQEEFLWSTTMLAAGYSMLRVESGLIGPLQGWLIDRYGPRASMRAGVAMLGGGFLAFSHVGTELEFFVVLFVMALGASFAGIMPVSVTLVCWFRRRRALALSIGLAGVSAGGMAVPLVALSMETWGWRNTATGSGILVLTAGWLLTRLFHHHPEDIGLAVDGDSSDTTVASDGCNKISDADSLDFSLSQALRTRAFWAVSLGHASSLVIVGTVMVHLVPHLRLTLGFSLSRASLGMLAVTALHFGGLWLGGLIGDRFEKRLVATACMLSHGIGLTILALAATWLGVLIFAILHGLAWGVRAPLMQAIRADYFGRLSYGKILGLSSVVVMIGSTGGPLVSGMLFDHLGSYRPTFLLMALIAPVGALFFFAARAPRFRPN